jgi:4-hydroxy-tetrahydrodipicolinate reductase
VPDGVGVVGLGRLGRGIMDACARLGQPVVLTVSRTGGWPASEVPSVIIDASAPEAQARVVDYCGRHGVALVECVSNLGQGQWAELDRLAGRVPVVRATNLTVGHYVHGRLVECLAALGMPAAFGPEASVLERHPATKAHRPSATAVALARIWSDGTGTEVAEICSRRAGPPVSEHEMQWTWPAETLVLRHSVHRIDAAAAGALAAARWTLGRPPGLVGMRDVYDDLTSAIRSSA